MHIKASTLADLILIVLGQAAAVLKLLLKHLRDPLVRICNGQ